MTKIKNWLIERPGLSAILSGFASIGYLYPEKFTPRRYPHSRADDMQRIGGDMWKAFATELNEKREQE